MLLLHKKYPVFVFLTSALFLILHVLITSYNLFVIGFENYW